MRRNITIIGGGPGGYVAAIRAAQLGASVTLVEKDNLGGTCLNWGCIPTKTLCQNAQIIHALSRSEEFGVIHSGFTIDMVKVQRRKERVVSDLRHGIAQLIKSYGIDYIEGTATFSGPSQLCIMTKAHEKLYLESDYIIIATGSVPATLPLPGTELPGVLNSNDLLAIADIPKSMIVVGGGVIGMEFASIFSSFGTVVTVVEYMPRILHLMDREIVARLSSALRKAGVAIATDMRVKSITRSESNTLTVLAEGKHGDASFAAENILVATGREINVAGLNLELVGVEYDRKGIKVDDKFATTAPGIYAIGDVIGGHMLAHVASEEGKACVEGILGQNGHINYNAVPAVVFTSPEVAAVGLSEDEATRQGIEIIVSKFLLGANSKAVTMGEEFGLVKVVARADNKQVIGVHVLGSHASTVIHEAALAVEHCLTVSDIGRTIHAHPTISEAFLEAVLGVEGRAIHAPPRVKRTPSGV
ncbi:MAG: Dihydrolipoyl dehydrogenase [Firmicutes bacterium]|nr:Dihydrolipoyl dehydrogenase [Bacillota bacterium]